MERNADVLGNIFRIDRFTSGVTFGNRLTILVEQFCKLINDFFVDVRTVSYTHLTLPTTPYV